MALAIAVDIIGYHRVFVWPEDLRIVNLYKLHIVDCSGCKFYTVIKLSTNYICIVVNTNSVW